jgi:hypothetical protein
MLTDMQFKDDHLAELANRSNLAQFVSFTPGKDPQVRHCKVAGLPKNRTVSTDQAGVDAIFKASNDSVNIHTFQPDDKRGTPFIYGITSPDEALERVRSLARDGYYTIVDETIDTHDGGVSGVAMNGIIEFAPNATPRAVELPGIASLPFVLGRQILTTVYGLDPELEDIPGQRIEFSIHPKKLGYRHTHTILWNVEHVPPIQLEAAMSWPNQFSQYIGDKLYGLLIANHLGLPVPATTAIPRMVAPFHFGKATGTSEVWLRTCPAIPSPGTYGATYGWTDPYALLATSESTGTRIASVIAQESVESKYGGASLPVADASMHVADSQDYFMAERQRPEILPEYVVDDVAQLARRAQSVLGSFRIEWVHDGHRAWVIQLHPSRDHASKGV